MPDFSEKHAWVGAATFSLNIPQARRAVLRHSVLLPEKKRVDVLEVYCAQCRRAWDDVADERCIAASTTEHLRGGPIGERKKRKHDHNCEVVGCEPPAPRESEDGDQITAVI